jgi:hypothetical protein
MPEISQAFRADRNEALHRVLRALPGDFLVALIEGLERADRIVAGRLFAGESGGCVVGVTLRAIEPGFRGRRMIWGRWARRSVVKLERGIAKGITHLYALEQVFDRSIERSPSTGGRMGTRWRTPWRSGSRPRRARSCSFAR